MHLREWEAKFSSIGLKEGELLLKIIPGRGDWEDFLLSVQNEWDSWEKSLFIPTEVKHLLGEEEFPLCMLALFGGIAFYEYDDNTFWPSLSKAINKPKFGANKQGRIGDKFIEFIERFKLCTLSTEGRSNYVGTAIYNIGIPLSLWDSFLDICDWAQSRKDWHNLPDTEWAEYISRQCGPRKRLASFLISNRAAAGKAIKELLEVREFLNTKEYSLAELKQISILRSEYLDEVPETAEFLCPSNPEVFYQDSPRLIWDNSRHTLRIQFPATAKEDLPATWSLNGHTINAASGPHGESIDSKGFFEKAKVEFKSNTRTDKKHLFGAKPWGLFDLENNGAFVNPRRDSLPLRSYVIISDAKTELPVFDGFDSDSQQNQELVLPDKTKCFASYLYPTGKFAKVTIKCGTEEKSIQFRTKLKIGARFYINRGWESARVVRYPDSITIDRLPLLCVTVPHGYFKDTILSLKTNFHVKLDNNDKAGGEWKRDIDTEEAEFYTWQWDHKPFVEFQKGKYLGLDSLRNAVKPKDLRGDHTLSVSAPNFGTRFELKVHIEGRRPFEICKCWQKLPGKFIPWFILSQNPDGMKREEIEIAQQIIAPSEKLYWHLFHRYEAEGLLALKGRFWTIRESRAAIHDVNGKSILEYCGDPSRLWKVYRCMIHEVKNGQLPVIDVEYPRGSLPFLKMVWDTSDKWSLQKQLRNAGITTRNTLWHH